MRQQNAKPVFLMAFTLFELPHHTMFLGRVVAMIIMPFHLSCATIPRWS